MTKSYNFEGLSKKKLQSDLSPDEKTTSQGYIIALACGPLKKQRYINPKIEQELVDFKKEIEDKFQNSKLQTFVFPRVARAPNRKKRSADTTDFIENT